MEVHSSERVYWDIRIFVKLYTHLLGLPFITPNLAMGKSVISQVYFECIRMLTDIARQNVQDTNSVISVMLLVN